MNDTKQQQKLSSREIKFRAWDGNRMYYCGTLSPDDNEISFHFFNGGIEWGVYDNSLGNRLVTGDPNAIFNTPGILMQYTGLKDKNGRDIYEGDIIEMKHPYKDRQYSGVVSWEEYMWTCKEFYFTHFDIPSEIFSEGTEHMEVIGNIYEGTIQNKQSLK